MDERQLLGFEDSAKLRLGLSNVEPAQKELAELLMKFSLRLVGFNYPVASSNGQMGDLDVVAFFDDTIFIFGVKNQGSGNRRTYGNATEFFAFCENNQSTIQSTFGTPPTIRYLYIFYEAASPSDTGLITELRELESPTKKIIFSDDVAYFKHSVEINPKLARNDFLSEIGMPPRRNTTGRTAVKCSVDGIPTYLLFVSPCDLFDCVAIPRKRSRKLGLSAYQRAIDSDRLKQISQYIRNTVNGFAFPNAIILSSINDISETEISNSDDRSGSKAVSINFPTDYGALKLIDGQHRLLAYSFTDENTQIQKRLEVIILGHLEPARLAKIFLDINSKMKVVDSNLRLLISSEIDWPTTSKKECREKIIVNRVLKLIDDGTLNESELFLGHAGMEHQNQSLHLRTLVSGIKSGNLDFRSKLEIEAYNLLKTVIITLSQSNNSKFYLSNIGFRILSRLLGKYFSKITAPNLAEFIGHLDSIPDVTTPGYGGKGAKDRADALLDELKKRYPGVYSVL